MAASGIGKLFGLGKNKPPKTPRKDYDSDEGDPYEYQDPSKLHPTQPPSNPGNQAIPNYPPPRPHHSPQFLRSDPDKRASAPVLSALEPSGYPQGLRPQRPQSSEHSKYINELSPKVCGDMCFFSFERRVILTPFLADFCFSSLICSSKLVLYLSLTNLQYYTFLYLLSFPFATRN